jgi:hypothetical protein
VWETHNGDIPDGMFVHHVDGDKSNNGIENLALMDGGKHSSYHTKKRIAENPEAYRKRFLAATQDLAKEWHKSEEGRLWHSKHAMDNSSFIDRTEDAICVVCGAHYKVTKVRKNKAMFCSGRCKAKHYRDTHRYAQVNRGTA